MHDDSKFILEEAGQNELCKVQDLEIIFSDTSNLSCLDRLTGLRRLTLIDTSMSKALDLRPVSATLQSLTLIKQNLTDMNKLVALPNLVELCLHKNSITRLAGLEGCPKLRRLWLCNNMIEKIEGLHALGDLRELCLQNNCLTKLTGLENNLSLRLLDVSRNNISKLSHLEALKHLANLREVSFQSDTFGVCPIVYQENYRQHAICVLKQIRKLDGEVVKDQDRSQAEDEFLQKALEFNDKIEDLHRHHRDELRNIEIERLKNIRSAEELKSQLISQFSKLQDVVSTGREKVRKEQQRQLDLREQNMDKLKGQLLMLRKQHREVLDGLLEEEKRTLEQEEKAFAHISRRARLELNEVVAMCELSQGVEVAADPVGRQTEDGEEPVGKKCIKRVAFQVLCNDTVSSHSMSSELKSLCLSIRDSQKRIEKFCIYRASKVFNSTLYEQHISKTNRDKTDGAACVSLMYIGVTDLASLKQVLQDGLMSRYTRFDINDDETQVSNGQNCGIVLCSDPQTAARLHGASSDMRGMYRVIQCRATLPRVETIAGDKESLSSLETAARYIMQVPVDSCAVKVTCPVPEADSEESFLVVRPSHAALLLSTMYITLTSPSGDKDNEGDNPPKNLSPESILAQDPGLEHLVQTITEKITKSGSGIPPELAERLERIESKIEHHISQYEERILQELDPNTAEQINRLETSVDKMEHDLTSVRSEIDSEKAKQERILRESFNGPSIT
mmetsp:Transcript_5090/g.8968  ORF Transcript_5090/g.8968 Transcript_5090/m.8968 type:complete len:733 (-) Transcript_5090:333-2531(-)|eukprot:CAMPEP_0203752036 /NCGR_PEP_ID=MMETSP0098-20131031/6020_1 /ASSEMBLY_ACC=CAM_ASM_000208 /TAXON_ID=96639 /ORGANISM=" , Strain NY0313808BC1" /LENGTH=732 /DNA_ID=CAMNT_0050642025 /DNA_START=190 /DNA_END=2388 /DNA_ORIENTATION=+